MFKKAQYKNTVNGQRVEIYNSWYKNTDLRHFMVITRICPVGHGTIRKTHVYPTLSDAMDKVPQIEQWLSNHQI